MPKKASEKVCCACLGTTLKMAKLSAKDPNKLTHYSKLVTCIVEIDWVASYHICEQCMKLLDISYTFRETCLRSDQARHKNIETKTDDDELYMKQVDKRVFVKETTANYPEIFDLGDTLNVKELKEETTDDELYDANSGEDASYQSDLDYKLDGTNCEPQTRKKRAKVQFTCEKCDNVYTSSIKLIKHCMKDHGLKKLDIRPFICDRCPSRFCNSSNLLQHVKYHDAVRSNMCTYCGKGFITKTDLNIHEKQHLNKREYRCEICGKCFNTHKDIRSHKLVVHTDSTSWKYCCEICNKPFPIKSNYDSHMRRHTGIRKFECHLCQRKFIDKCVLQRHMRTHSNVREHKCMHCEREYKDPGVLKVHMAKNHGIGVGQIKIPNKEKKYICHICPKSYYAKNKLTRHLYTHSGEKPFSCPVCGKKFIDKSYVKQHLKKSHNMDRAPEQSEMKNEMNQQDINFND